MSSSGRDVGDEARDRQERLVEALSQPSRLGVGTTSVRRVETHISYVLLDGRHAYKIKKAVALGFLDFTRLDDRRRYCEIELALNRRTAPDVYLDVVPITGTEEDPRIGGEGDPIEWTLRMREFPQHALLSDMLARGALTDADIDALAAVVATFHRGARASPPDATFGSPDDVLALALDNFAPLRQVVGNADSREVAALEAWTKREHADRRTLFAQRRDDGHVRECHGDLHLRNIARIDDAIVLFDCIEFSERLRWIDVVSEIAFTAMDLHSADRPEFAHRFVNAYLESTGDYGGLPLLRFYLVYRALVRAKVAALRIGQAHSDREAGAALADDREHVALATAFAKTRSAALVVTHGFSGCGKTTITQALVDRLGAVRIRTDVERKRLHGLAAAEQSGSAIAGGLYATETTQRVYAHVATLMQAVLDAGSIGIVDGAFLRRWQRDLLRKVAETLAVPFVIATFTASDATLRERVARRSQTGADASEATLAVLEAQRASAEPLSDDEVALAVPCDAEQPIEAASNELLAGIARRLAIDRTVH